LPARAANQPTTVHFRRLFLLVLVGFPAGLFAAKAEIYPGLGRKWQFYQSPNFELYSANGDRDSRDVLERMELLRALFFDTFKFEARLPQPVTISSFDRQADFDGYRPPHLRDGDARYMGFCSNDYDRTVISLAPSRSRETATEVVYHEYIHYLFRVAEQNPSPWFNEGVAELFSTLEENKEWLELGKPVAGRVFELQQGVMMPFEQLFAVRYESPLFKDSRHSGMFYAQSWAFLHYCHFGVNKVPRDKMSQFLRIAGAPGIQDRPADLRAACRDLLGMDYQELEKELEKYVRTGRFQGRRAKRPVIAPRASYTVRPAPPEEMKLLLAELAVRMTDSPYGNLLMREQLERAPQARWFELMGSVAMKAGETDVARERWRAAIAHGTSNAAVYRELGRLEANAIFGQFDLDYRMPERRTAEMRLLLHKSLECAPAQSQGYEMLAWVEAMTERPDLASIRRIQDRFANLNDRARTLLALVIVRMRLGQHADALELLDQMEKLEPSDWVRYCAELTRARLEDRAVDPARLPKSTGPGIRVRLPAVIPPL
jgi:tetratricopeptide (TPR) repeat protein